MIRPARTDEADTITEIALRSKAYWGYSDAFMARVRAELTLTPEFIERNPTFVSEVDGKIAGFYSLKDLGDGVVDLYYLFVAPEAIGGGHGKRLLLHAFETARASGFREMLVEADPNAEAFYAKMGMTRCGQRESSVEVGRVLPLLRLAL
jgi:N-acetylglutamate synthase-like GNAT family acetyltransferase